MLLRDLATGLLAVHVVWAVAYLLGIMLLASLRSADGVAGDRGIDDRIDFVLATATGLALITLCLFALGSVHELFPGPCTILGLGVLIALGGHLRSRRASTRSAVAAIFKPLGIFRSRAALAIYVIALVESPPAVLPPVQWDSTMYHLAHAVNWALSGRIYADPFIRTPYFAYNVELYYASAFVYHLGHYVLFWGWLPFVASALALQVTVMWLIARFVWTEPRDARAANALAFVAGVAFLASPLVLRYAVSGYVDVMGGFFFLAAVLALMRSVRDPEGYAYVAAIVGGVFIGTKLQLVLFMPLFIVGFLLVTRRSSRRLRTALTATAIFGICAAPWFARNWLLTGDPISPVLNMFLGHADPIFSRADYAGMQWNLHYGVGSIFDAPVDFVLGRPFLDEPGTSASVAFISLVAVAAIAVALFRRRWNVAPELSLVLVSTAYAIIAIAAVSVHTERYILAYFDLLIAALTILVAVITKRLSSRFFPHTPHAAVALSIAVLAAISLPEPITAAAYQPYVSSYNAVDDAELRPDAYLASAGGSDYEARDIARLAASSRVPGNVLAPGFENAAYYFRAEHVVSIGDWFGPGRYSDLEQAIQRHGVPAYLQRFRVDAVIFGPRNIGWTDQERHDFEKAVLGAGYIDVSLRSDPIREYVRPDVLERADATVLSAAPRTPSRFLESMQIDFIKDFAAGTMSSSSRVPTPTGTGVFTYNWPRDGAATPTITLLAGFSDRFDRVRLRHAAVVSVDVGKPLAEGKDVIAWIDITVGGRTKRLIERVCEPRTTGIAWHHLEVAVPDAGKTVTLTFGASSEPGGGTADWVAFANPRLLNASLGLR